MKIRMTFLAFILINLSFFAQNIQVEVFPPTIKCLPCMAMDWEVTVTNTGEKNIWLAGDNLERAVDINTHIPAEYSRENGDSLTCYRSLYDPSTPITMEPDQDAKIKHKILFKAGESFKVHMSDYPGIYCPIDRDISGLWNGKVTIPLYVAEGDYVRDIKKLLVYGKFSVELAKIKDGDMAAVKAVWDEAIKANPRYEIKEGRPTWFDYFSCPSSIVEKVLFQKYPQSLYAGDCLVNNGLSGPLDMYSRMTKEEFDKLYHLVGSTADKEKRRAEIEKGVTEFITDARKFLSLNEDFCREDMMRRQIANSLFIMNRPQEAWQEVEKLSKRNSIYANEAKALLANRMKYQVNCPQKDVKDTAK